MMKMHAGEANLRAKLFVYNLGKLVKPHTMNNVVKHHNVLYNIFAIRTIYMS